ncbi:MAG TPA: hypothetical protein VGT41_04665 [Candidatus Babeliales bacterium]|nr:hypothetical protein [Candidatus Babeliales bacterium]
MKRLLIVFCGISVSFAAPPPAVEAKKTVGADGNTYIDITVNAESGSKADAASNGKLEKEKEDPEDCSKYIDKELLHRMRWVSYEKWVENMAHFSKYKREKYLTLSAREENFASLRGHYKKMRQNRPVLEKQYGKEFVDHVIDTVYGHFLEEEKRINKRTWFNSPLEKFIIAYEGVKYNPITGEWE